MKTVSLELAKTLKEAGYPQDKSYFTWVIRGSTKEYYIVSEDFEDGGFLLSGDGNIDAPMADELLDLLPHYIKKPTPDGYPFEMWINKHNGEWNIGYQTVKNYPLMSWRAETLADVAAKAWLYLKEHNNIEH